MNNGSAARQANAPANTSGTEPALKYVQANGVRFAYLEQGDGPLVMFLHGFPDNAWSYRKQLQVFAEAGYRAVAPFLRGYAPTEIPADGIFDPIALGKDLEALIAALSDDGQARVVGMDWGGTSTFQALATAPSAIKAGTILWTTETGMVKPTPELLPEVLLMAKLTPTTSPLRFRSGPPELPGLIAVSVWMTSGNE